MTVANSLVVYESALQSAGLLSMTGDIASNMHLDASRSLTEPCLTDCILY